MFFAKIDGTSLVYVEGEAVAVYQLGCVACGNYVATETGEFLEYLAKHNESLFCNTCDPLPEMVPPLLEPNEEEIVWLESSAPNVERIGYSSNENSVLLLV